MQSFLDIALERQSLLSDSSSGTRFDCLKDVVHHKDFG
jgi:hypothetical protein